MEGKNTFIVNEINKRYFITQLDANTIYYTNVQ